VHKNVAVAAFAALIFLGASASCGCKGEADPAHLPFAYIHGDCSPTDGLATVFNFTSKPIHPDKYEEPFLTIYVNDISIRSAPSDYAIKKGELTLMASWCPSPGKCVVATSGNLHITSITPKGMTGAYELHFPDGSVAKNTFDATWAVSRAPIACG
jgi:hypothetical protein